MICGGISFVDRKINCLQALAWWVTDLTLWGKNIDLNNFKSDVLSENLRGPELTLKVLYMVNGS